MEGGGRQMKFAAFSFSFKCDCFVMFQAALGTLTELPGEHQEWRECSEIVQNMKSA